TAARRGSSRPRRAPGPEAAQVQAPDAVPRRAQARLPARRAGLPARTSPCPLLDPRPLLDPPLQTRHAAQPPVGVRGAMDVVVADLRMREDKEPALVHRGRQRVGYLLWLDRGVREHNLAGSPRTGEHLRAHPLGA